MRVRIKTIGFLFAGLLSSWAFVQAGSGQEQQTGLKSDEEAIRAFVEQYGAYETSGPNGEYTSEKEHVVFEGCRLTVHVEAVGADGPPYKRETIKFDVVIDLKKMDAKALAAPMRPTGQPIAVFGAISLEDDHFLTVHPISRAICPVARTSSYDTWYAR